MNSEVSFEYRNLNENDFESTLKILRYDYTYNEPVSVKLNVSVDCTQLISYRSYRITQALKQHVSVGAFKKDSGELVGCAVACFPMDITEQYEDSESLDVAPLNYRQMLALLSCCDEGVTDAMGDNKYMDITYMACRQGYSGCGIGKKLFERVMDNARQNSCKKVFVIAFSHYVQRIAEKNGFQYHREVAYSEYVDPFTGTKVFSNMPQPHVKAATLTKTL